MANRVEEISYQEAKQVMKNIQTECATKEQQIQDIHRYIYETETALKGQEELEEQFKGALERERAHPSMEPRAKEEARFIYNHTVDSIDNMKRDLEQAYEDMFEEYKKINRMRKVFAVYKNICAKMDRDGNGE